MEQTVLLAGTLQEWSVCVCWCVGEGFYYGNVAQWPSEMIEAEEFFMKTENKN